MPEIEIIHGDITEVQVDAIVNAANTRMRGGGGVDGAIHRVGGPAVLEDCVRRFPQGLTVGDAGYTTAGNLPAQWVIHTVGPDFARRQRNRGLLESCYRRSLAVADELGAATVAFPLISAGAYSWPLEDAIAAAIDTIGSTPTGVEVVNVVTLNLATCRAMNDYRGFAIPFRILEGVGDLHRRGFQSVRIGPSISPSGMYWRLAIGVGGGRDGAVEIAKDDRTVLYGSGAFEMFAHGIVTGSTHLRVIGDLILAELGGHVQPCADPEYAAWYRDLLAVSQEIGFLPWAFDDYGDHEGGWLGDDLVQLPPPWQG